jgi:uncharacterized membrane protein
MMHQTGNLSKQSINVGPGERIISVVGGSLLILSAIARPRKLGIPLFLSGGYLIYRGVSGHCLTYQILNINRAGEKGELGISNTRALTINRPRQDVYNFWRNLENLPTFMEHLESVETLDGGEAKISHWKAKALLDKTVEWDAEIYHDLEYEEIAWRSLPGSFVPNSGEVYFRDAPGGRGTEVHVRLVYNPPGGSAAAAIARIFGKEPDRQIAGDLRRLKQIMEAGEIPTVTGQTSGRIEQTLSEREQIKRRKGKDIVQIASEESFPASDPPSYTSSEKEKVIK